MKLLFRNFYNGACYVYLLRKLVLKPLPSFISPKRVYSAKLLSHEITRVKCPIVKEKMCVYVCEGEEGNVYFKQKKN